MSEKMKIQLVLTAGQVEHILDALEVMPESPVNEHLIHLLKYSYAFEKQRQLLSFDSCVNMGGTALCWGATTVVLDSE